MTTTRFRLQQGPKTVYEGTAEEIARTLVGDKAHPALFEDTVREVQYHGEVIEGAAPTHRVEQWSTNFRGERVFTDVFYGTKDQCEAYLTEHAPGEAWTSVATPGHHLALRKIDSPRVVKHTGPKGFNHSTQKARYA